MNLSIKIVTVKQQTYKTQDQIMGTLFKRIQTSQDRIEISEIGENKCRKTL